MKNITITLFLFLCLSTIAQTDNNLNAYLNNLFLDLSSLTTKSEILHAIQSDNNFKDVEIGIGEDGGIITLFINSHPLFENLQEEHALLIFFDDEEDISKIILIIRGNHFDEISSVFTNQYFLEKHEIADETFDSFGFTLNGEDIFLKIDMMKIEIPKELIETEIIFPEDTFVSFYPKALN